MTQTLSFSNTRRASTGLASDGETATDLEGSPVDGIQLIGDGDEAVNGVFPSLLSLYTNQGYQQGYRRAVYDLLASLVSTTEDFLLAQSPSPDSSSVGPAELRRVVYQFGQHLERRVQAMTLDEGYVSNGLGI